MGRTYLYCTQGDRNGSKCPLPVTEFTEQGLVVMNKHSGRKHLNCIPFDWIVDEVRKNPVLRDFFLKALDKSV